MKYIFSHLYLTLILLINCGTEVGNPTESGEKKNIANQGFAVQYIASQYDEAMANILETFRTLENQRKSTNSSSLKGFGLFFAQQDSTTCSPNPDGSISLDESNNYQTARIGKEYRVDLEQHNKVETVFSVGGQALNCTDSASIIFNETNFTINLDSSFQKTIDKSWTKLINNEIERSSRIDSKGNKKVLIEIDLGVSNPKEVKTIEFKSVQSITSSISEGEVSTSTIQTKANSPIKVHRSIADPITDSLILESGVVEANFKDDVTLMIEFSDLLFKSSSSCSPTSGEIYGEYQASLEEKKSFTISFVNQVPYITFQGEETTEIEIAICPVFVEQ